MSDEHVRCQKCRAIYSRLWFAVCPACAGMYPGGSRDD